MITYSQAVFLGLIQGLTEFIPISSTAHLRIVPAFLDLPDPGAAYSAVLQLGTLFSLLLYFRKDIVAFTTAVIRGTLSGHPFRDPDAKMAWYLVIGTVPISIIGLLFKDFITGDARSLYVISGSLIGLALILLIVDLRAAKIRNIHTINWIDALLIGLGQSMALIPGSSRSGTTLTMGMVLGLTREAAMRFSFLLGIPAIGLSGVYELIQEWNEIRHLGPGGLLVGTIVAFISGYLSVAGLLRYLRTRSTLVFVVYRIALGLLILWLLHRGILVDNIES